MQTQYINSTDFFQYKGAIHIHTKYSDGTGDINSITKAAKKAGLDWIIITDHNYLDDEEGIFNGVYVIKGEEISPKSSNHYLAFGVNENIMPTDSPQDYVNKVRELGGFGFAAHPDEGMYIDNDGNTYPRKNSNHCIPWADKNIEPDGVEIWNWFSNWADNLDDSNIFTLAYAYLFKHRIVTNPSFQTLDWWDRLNNKYEKIVPAIGGVDAHALKFYKYIWPVTVFPYKTCFETITNIINLREPLSNDFCTAKKQILNSVKLGKNLIVNRKNGNIIPNIKITNSYQSATCGENIDLDNNTFLIVETKKPYKIKIVLDEKEIDTKITNNYKLKLDLKGKYRVEILSGKRGFAYSNPIVVK